MGEQIGAISYYLTLDHLGSIRELTDTSGTVQARYDYDPYGYYPLGFSSNLISGTDLSDFQYAGMYKHNNSNLNLTKFREYDSSMGRWLSRDPFGEGSDQTLYSYVLNNPVNGTDPYGENAYVTIAGHTTSISNANSFIHTLASAVPYSITKIVIVGHGAYDNIAFNYSSGDPGSLYMKTENGKENVYIEDPVTHTATPISAIAGKLAKGAIIKLDGCHTQHGPDNITNAIARQLPDQKVTGNYYTAGAIRGTDYTITLSIIDRLAGDPGPSPSSGSGAGSGSGSGFEKVGNKVKILYLIFAQMYAVYALYFSLISNYSIVIWFCLLAATIISWGLIC